MEQGSNRTIARNTLMLYARSILMMVIGLYTSRIILRALGVTDFGIYNAVGGIVGMFGFISASLSNATSRFITIAIGGGDKELTNKTFGNIKVIYYGLCVVIVLLGETFGLWFLYNKMSIPADRMDAAFWVYQYSILSTVLGLICVPYSAAIIAHERMSAFAYISLLEAVLKLLICYLLLISSHDKLIVYATLLFFVGLMDRIIYTIYCNKRFEEVHASPKIYKEQFSEIITMSGWTLSGNIANILNTQGINLMLNVFFGPVVNAARGIALQVQSVMGQFVTNFQTALNPQITKSFARHDYKRIHELLHLSSKYSYFLMFIMSIPVFIEAPVILKWWLVIIPDNTVIYLRIILVYAVLSTLSNPLWISILATGQLKKYQIYDNIVQLSVLPIAYIAFQYFGASSYWIFLILLFSEILEISIRIYIVLPIIHHQYMGYIREVAIPLLLVSVSAPVIPVILDGYFSNQLVNFFVICALSFFCSMVFIWLVGLRQKEKAYIIGIVRTKFLNKLRKEI